MFVEGFEIIQREHNYKSYLLIDVYLYSAVLMKVLYLEVRKITLTIVT